MAGIGLGYTRRNIDGGAALGRFEDTIAAIDAINAEDPNVVAVGDREGPKELLHSELLSAWVCRLQPDASEQLLLAARAQHIRRWTVPRSSFPEGRTGYLRWRTSLYAFHADEAARVLQACGFDDAIVDGVRRLVGKRAPAGDPAAQVLEDALCLVFLETQFAEISERMPDE
jgi:hypothetical protein